MNMIYTRAKHACIDYMNMGFHFLMDEVRTCIGLRFFLSLDLTVK